MSKKPSYTIGGSAQCLTVTYFPGNCPSGENLGEIVRNSEESLTDFVDRAKTEASRLANEHNQLTILINGNWKPKYFEVENLW